MQVVPVSERALLHFNYDTGDPKHVSAKSLSHFHKFRVISHGEATPPGVRLTLLLLSAVVPVTDTRGLAHSRV